MSILIKDCGILKLTGEDDIIKRGYILIEDDKIKDIGEGEYEQETDKIHNIIDGSGSIALPGLINTHTHCSMTLLRGYGEGMPLMRWLNERIWPFEAKLTPDDIYIGAKLAALEMIKSGTTCFLDMYYFEDRICEAVGESGIRGVICTPVIGDDWEARVKRFTSFYENYNNSFDGRIKTMIAPHAPYTCSRKSLEETAKAAAKVGCGVHIHISETEDEVETIRKNYGCTPLKFVEETGILESGNVIAAHCVHMSDEDLFTMKTKGVNVSHCPQSNMKLSSGVSPVWRMMDMGINVSLGTDGTSSNNNLDMVEEMQTASYLQKLYTKDATALPAYKCIKMATVNGAAALDMAKDLGRLEKGMKADVVLIDINKPAYVPMHDIYANIVFSGSGRDVKTVIVNGKLVMKDYQVLTIDEEKLLREVEAAVGAILRK